MYEKVSIRKVENHCAKVKLKNPQLLQKLIETNSLHLYMLDSCVYGSDVSQFHSIPSFSRVDNWMHLRDTERDTQKAALANQEKVLAITLY